MPETSPERAEKLYGLCMAYSERYTKSSAIEDLEAAVQMAQNAVNATPEGHADLACRVRELGSLYGSRYQITGSRGDLEIAFQQFHEAIEKQSDLSERLCYLNDLAYLHQDEYDNTGSMASLEQAINLFKETLDVSESHPEYPNWLYCLARAYQRKYYKTGTIESLDLCVKLGHASLDKTPREDSDRALRLCALATSYEQRFMRLGAMADLNKSIELSEEAYEQLAGNDEHNLRDGIIHGLVRLQTERSEKTRSKTDRDLLLQRVKDSLDRTPEDHPSRPSLLATMAQAHYDRFLKVKDLVDCEQSIKFRSEALEKTLEDSTELANQLQQLSNAYSAKFEVTGCSTDLQQAIELSHKALDKVPENHQRRAYHLGNLADLYFSNSADNMSYLINAIKLYQQALVVFEQLLDDDPDQCWILHKLAKAHWARYVIEKAPTDLQQSIQLFHRLFNFPRVNMMHRLFAGRSLLGIYAMTNDWSEAYEAASRTLPLVSLLTPRFLQTSDKQDLLKAFPHLGSDAAAVALMAGKEPIEAIRLLELGRGIIAGSQYDMRRDVSELHQQHPQMAQEYIELRDQLEFQVDEAQFDQLSTPHSMKEGNQRYTVSQQLEEKINAIRRMPGFEQFLSAPSRNELSTASQMGPIVIINASRYRCDALIIHNSECRALPLPRLQIADICAVEDTFSGPELNTELLELLWDTIAEPVLENLGFTQRPTGDLWPRLWWIPTGPLVKFPIHAAGYHGDGLNTVMDRVASSYNTSVKALIQSRAAQNQLNITMGPEAAVLVSMANTPGQTYLPYVSHEIGILDGICKSMRLEVTKPPTLVSDVLSALKNCKIFHFAGHGRSHHWDSMKSALLLSDDELTVASLFEINLHHRKPFLAYLSACGTGQINDDRLPNEAIHLTAACQLAGFQHVIGTLWSVNDEASVEMANLVYKWLASRGLSDQSVSEGLHHASRELRSQWIQEKAARGESQTCGTTSSGQIVGKESMRPSERMPRDTRDVIDFGETPLHWVPFVHFGI